jgi:TolA-binding protein
MLHCLREKFSLKSKNFSEAEKSFRKSVQDFPTCFEAWEGLGDCLYGSGDAAGAVKKYKSSAKLNPKSFNSFFQLGL